MAITRNRLALFGLALSAGLVAMTIGANGAVEMTTGIRYVVPSGTTADCGAKAQTALNAYLIGAQETTAGSGDWSASGAIENSTASAVVHCVGLPKGYVVTFTCAVQLPGSLYHGSDLCLDVAHTFIGKPVTPLATPTPLPACGSLTNLVGTWVSRGDGPTFKMDTEGGLTGDDGVIGNWYMRGMSATIRYGSDHVVTLSADGKHLDGGGYHLTRQC